MSQRFTPASSNTPTLFLIVSLVLTGAMGAAARPKNSSAGRPRGAELASSSSSYSPIRRLSERASLLRGGLLNKLDERLSIIVTDKASTSAITSRKSCDKLADDMRCRQDSTCSRRWWDTATKFPDGMTRTAPTNVFCNSETDVVSRSIENQRLSLSMPKRQKGDQASVDPFTKRKRCPPCRI